MKKYMPYIVCVASGVVLSNLTAVAYASKVIPSVLYLLLILASLEICFTAAMKKITAFVDERIMSGKVFNVLVFVLALVGMSLSIIFCQNSGGVTAELAVALVCSIVVLLYGVTQFVWVFAKRELERIR